MFKNIDENVIAVFFIGAGLVLAIITKQESIAAATCGALGGFITGKYIGK